MAIFKVFTLSIKILLHDTTFQMVGKDFVQIFKDFVKSIDFCSVFGVI